MMDPKGFCMTVNTRAPPAPSKQLSGTMSDSVSARGECGGAELICAWRAHLRLNNAAIAQYLMATKRNRRRIARDARKKQQCKHNTAHLQAFVRGGGVKDTVKYRSSEGADERFSERRMRPRHRTEKPPAPFLMLCTSPTRWAHRRRHATDGLFRKSVFLTALPGGKYVVPCES